VQKIYFENKVRLFSHIKRRLLNEYKQCLRFNIEDSWSFFYLNPTLSINYSATKPHCFVKLQCFVLSVQSFFCYRLRNIKTSMLYFDTFLATMHREWMGIDRLRMDKFYLLFRFMLQNAFICLKNNDWDDSKQNGHWRKKIVCNLKYHDILMWLPSLFHNFRSSCVCALYVTDVSCFCVQLAVMIVFVLMQSLLIHSF